MLSSKTALAARLALSLVFVSVDGWPTERTETKQITCASDDAVINVDRLAGWAVRCIRKTHANIGDEQIVYHGRWPPAKKRVRGTKGFPPPMYVCKGS
jgi:hypothetical protein